MSNFQLGEIKGWVAPAFIAAISAIWLLLGLFWAETGNFVMDSMVYRAMVDAFVRDGSLFVENGYATYKSPSLGLHLLVPQGDRLAPQYPGAWGILASPGYMIAGTRGLIVQSGLTGIATMVLVWLTARTFFADRRIELAAVLIYAFGTFAIDYHFGLWPHAPAAGNNPDCWR